MNPLQPDPDYDGRAEEARLALDRPLMDAEKDFFGLFTRNRTVSFLIGKSELHSSRHELKTTVEDNPREGFPKETRNRRTLRADFMRWILFHPQAKHWFQESGLEIWGARIEGPLDLGFLQFPFRLHLHQCWFGAEDPPLTATDGEEPKKENPTLEEAHVSFRYAKIFSLSLSGSTIEGGKDLCLRGAHIQRTLFLRRGFQMGGHLDLCNARIQGDLDLQGAYIDGSKSEHDERNGKRGYALDAEGVVVDGAVYLSKGFVAAGRVNLHRAIVRGDINGIGGSFRQKDGEALRLRKAQIEGSVLLCHSHPSGIAGENKGDSPASPADSLATIIEGQLSMESARIRGNLILTGARLVHPTLAGSGDLPISSPHFAVQAEGVQVDGQIKLDWARVTGQLRFENAKIGGDFFGEALEASLSEGIANSTEAKLPARPESRFKVLSLEKACVGGSVVIWRSERRPQRIGKGQQFFPAILGGVVDLRGAQVEGNIAFTGAEIGLNVDALKETDRPTVQPPALSAEGLQVEGRVGLDGGFLAHGKVSFHNVTVGGDFSARGCRLNNPGDLALDLERAQIGGSFLLQAQPPRQKRHRESLKPESSFLACVVKGSINLSGATVKGNIVIRGAHCTAAKESNRKLPHPLRASICARGATIRGHVQIDRGRYPLEDGKSEPDTVGIEGEHPRAQLFGPVDFRRATIGGTMSILDADLYAEREGADARNAVRECALRLEGANIEGSIQTREHLPFPSEEKRKGALLRGGIDLRNARVSGDVNLHLARLIGDHWYYFTSERRNEAGEHGAIPRAHRHRDEYARPACWASNAVIDGNVSFRDSKTFGVITFYSARIGGRLNVRGIEKPDDPPPPRIEIPMDSGVRREEVEAGRIYLSIDLSYLRCDVLQAGGANPMPGCLALDGLTYRGLDVKYPAGDKEGHVALWLDAQHATEWRREMKAGRKCKIAAEELSFPPQPYELAVTVLERQGLEEHAEKVVTAQRALERDVLGAQVGTLPPWKRIYDSRTLKRAWLKVAKWFGHGYNYGHAFRALAVLWLGGGVIFHYAYVSHCFVPTQETAWHGFEENQGRRNPDEGWSPYYPHFRAWTYSLDLCIPFVDFGQANFWEPNPTWMVPHDSAEANGSATPVTHKVVPTPRAVGEAAVKAPPKVVVASSSNVPATPVPAEQVVTAAVVAPETPNSAAEPHDSAPALGAGADRSQELVMEASAAVLVPPEDPKKESASNGPVLVNGARKQTPEQSFWGTVAFYYLPLHIISGWFLSTLSVLGLTRLLRRREVELPGSE